MTDQQREAFQWAILDSNQGPLPYQKGQQGARSGPFALQMRTKQLNKPQAAG
jgi:hypothetical protein